jgi:nucleotide-binding universal stress UspA family protein
MYKRILCPIDGSETSNAGLAEAIRLAQYEHATIRLIYVLDTVYLQSTGYMIGEIYDQLRATGTQLLEAAKTKVAAAGIGVETVLADANTRQIADAIIAECHNWSADVIVMGTHGHRGVSRLFLGSDAEAVIRLSTVPVLLVKSGAAN